MLSEDAHGDGLMSVSGRAWALHGRCHGPCRPRPRLQVAGSVSEGLFACVGHSDSMEFPQIGGRLARRRSRQRDSVRRNGVRERRAGVRQL